MIAASRDPVSYIVTNRQDPGARCAAESFNELLQGITAAEAEDRVAYMGSIRALATALDARDPYTAGHSERVSTLSVPIGRQMRLPEAELDVLRLGALLHDIGKIGISDAVLANLAR